jgi:hypothetical protein
VTNGPWFAVFFFNRTDVPNYVLVGAGTEFSVGRVWLICPPIIFLILCCHSESKDHNMFKQFMTSSFSVCATSFFVFVSSRVILFFCDDEVASGTDRCGGEHNEGSLKTPPLHETRRTEIYKEKKDVASLPRSIICPSSIIWRFFRLVLLSGISSRFMVQLFSLLKSSLTSRSSFSLLLLPRIFIFRFLFVFVVDLRPYQLDWGFLLVSLFCGFVFFFFLFCIEVRDS